MTASRVDHEMMARALRLARQGLYTTEPNPRVGCVLVRDGTIVGEGWHAKAGEAHAEVRAIEQAADCAAGATAYVTLEPCCHHGRTPPCTDALIAAGVGRVIVGARDPNPEVAGEGIARLQAAGIDVEAGLAEAESRELNCGYFQRREHGRPYIRSKIAASLDGRTALSSGASKWITGEAAREDVQRLRARSSAILTGVETVIADDPSLNVRSAGLGNVLQPVRMVLDSRLRMPTSSRLLDLPGDVRIFCVQSEETLKLALEKKGANVAVLPEYESRVSLTALMNHLTEAEINEVLVEAGPVLNGALLTAGLIDELVIYTAAHILGDKGRPMFSLPALEEMSQRVELKLTDIRRVGDDCRMTYKKA